MKINQSGYSLKHDEEGILHIDTYRNEYQLFHWPKQVKSRHPLEDLMEMIDPQDWVSILGHPDDVVETDTCQIIVWDPDYVPELILRAFGDWEGMWEEMEDVVRRMKRKIPGAPSPGLNRALENAPHNPVDIKLDSVYQEAQ